MSGRKRKSAFDGVAAQVALLAREAAAPLADDELPRFAAPSPAAGYQPPLLPVTTLRFHREQQPRDMLPAEAWEDIEARGENTPAGVLAALRAAAETREPSRAVLEHVEELARSIRSEGVLVPLCLVPKAGEYVVLDGHCRSMAAVLAERAEVPVQIVPLSPGDSDAELTAAAHRFLLNATQKRLTPLESMREVVRLVELAKRVVLDGASGAAQPGEEPLREIELDDDEAEAPAPAPAEGADSGEARARGQTRRQALARAVRDLVLQKTGLSRKRYEELYRLRRLNPEAQARAVDAGLSEGHLLPILGVPDHLQPLLVDLIQRSKASVAETRAHCRMIQQHGEGYLVEQYAKVTRQRERRPRTAVSWESLLHAVPEDLTPRLSALRAELAALPPDSRRKRLDALARQRDLCLEAARAFAEVLDLYRTDPADDR